MKTISFVGSDKNAGKTTSFNFVYDKYQRGPSPICITSIGLNGERQDNYEGHGKPTIAVLEDSYFITAGEHLKNHTGKYQTLEIFGNPHFKKAFVFGRATTPFEIILEGPNEKHELVKIKKSLKKNFEDMVILIDGSIDRQFIASPEVSDSFFFALLISNRKEQLQKAKDLLEPISFPVCGPVTKKILDKHVTDSTKSLLLDLETGEIIHQSGMIPFMDDQLKKSLEDNVNRHIVLYLSGALTKSLYGFLSPYKKLSVVLDNFTLYHNITVKQSFDRRVFFPKLELLNPVIVERIFIKEEGERFAFDTGGIPVTNIFKEDFHAVGIKTECN